MKNIALLTYHSAYNYGSMLQAFATQTALEQIGGKCDIINYRMQAQRDYYSLVRSKSGPVALIKDTAMLPVMTGKRKAFQKYERFLRDYMHLTREVAEPDGVKKIWTRYDIAVSGSDQIWNKHSFELEHVDWSYMDPYLLKGFTGRKISYASSVGGMTKDELERIAPVLREFDHISTREASTGRKLQSLLDRQVTSVLDPTFLLDSNQWIDLLNLKKREEEPYILYYSLRGYKQGLRRIPILRALAKKHGYKMKVITPVMVVPYLDANIKSIYDMGPVDFLESIYNAKMVVSESYHGTILALNFNKNTFSVCGRYGAEFRKVEIMKKLGLKERIIYRFEDLLKDYAEINYDSVNRKIQELAEDSRNYLKKALTS